MYIRLRNLVYRLINELRLLDLKLSGAKVGNGVKVYGRFSWVGPGENITIGASCTINEGVFINARDRVTIGSHVHLSPAVQIHTGALTIDSKRRKHVQSAILIEDNVWLASGVVVSKGVKIGTHSVVGANSVITSDIPPAALYGGVPARFIRNIQVEM